jgi:hypothetical protein
MWRKSFSFLVLAVTFVLACSSSTTTRQGFDGTGDQTNVDANQPPEDVACTPSCSGKECGDDGCGGTCGSCTGKLKCSAASSKCEFPLPPGVSCPPKGNPGKVAGAVVISGTLPLASGGTYDVRANCGKPIYMLGVTETCGICMQQLGQWTRAGQFLDQLKAEGVDVVLISTDNPSGQPGSVQTAEALRRRFNLGTRFILGYEPAGSSGPNFGNAFITKRTGYGGARIALIVKPGNIIGAVGQVDDEQEIRDALGL